jgi:DNA helicase IV
MNRLELDFKMMELRCNRDNDLDAIRRKEDEIKGRMRVIQHSISELKQKRVQLEQVFIEIRTELDGIQREKQRCSECYNDDKRKLMLKARAEMQMSEEDKQSWPYGEPGEMIRTGLEQ